MKNVYLCLLVIISTASFAQNAKMSSASEFIDSSSYIQINLDENEKAIFKSGWNETVQFFPAEIIDLKQNTRMYGLNVTSEYDVTQQHADNFRVKEDAWIGMEEIDDMIVWLEQYVIPNLEASAGKNKTVKYIFNSDEITLKFEIQNNTKVFSVILNNSAYLDKYFWTEAKVKEIPKVLAALKYLQTKA
ncbi:hypothetical protein AMR72_06200 [Flavobacterium psychrophilum]|nr:hypothetical protein AMR72_06200 [Flavobacterium psychrophilum]AOE52144.1 hypothetical protein ALW18_06190 [Flavobacterium psychrophilum]